jgi:murein DD-endopeptidase MepM/ murein hydrolase activator NlpD
MRAREFLKEESAMSLVKKVASANGIANPNLIKVGQQLTLPGGNTYTVATGDTLYNIVTGQFKGKPPVAGSVKTGPNPNIDDPTRQRAQASVANLPKPATTTPATTTPAITTPASNNPSASSPEIKPVNGSVSSPFGNRINPVTGQPQSHAGVDIPAGKGTPIKAPISGKVTQATPESPVCGGTIAISNGKIQHRFCHCSNIDVKVGQEVSQGDVVGLTGGKKGDPGAGRSTGPHLHWEKKNLVTGQLMNPVALA